MARSLSRSQVLAALGGKRLEKHEQADTVRLIERLGGKCYVLGTRRPKGDYQGTRQTPGVADVLAFLPPRHTDAGPIFLERWTLLCIEQKTARGRLSAPQVEFRQLCLAAGVNHVSGDARAVAAYLKQGGWLK